MTSMNHSVSAPTAATAATAQTGSDAPKAAATRRSVLGGMGTVALGIAAGAAFGGRAGAAPARENPLAVSYPLGKRIATFDDINRCWEAMYWDHISGCLITGSGYGRHGEPGLGGVYRVRVNGAQFLGSEFIADCGGFVTSIRPASDGGFIICQVGSYAASPPNIVASRTTVPTGVQRIYPNGKVEYIYKGNIGQDFCLGPDGTIYADILVDAGGVISAGGGGIIAIHLDGTRELLNTTARGKGPIVDIDGTSLLKAGTGSQPFTRTGNFGRNATQSLPPVNSSNDGFALDVNGIVYGSGRPDPARPTTSMATAFNLQTGALTALPLENGGLAQCSYYCFGGDGLTTLYGLGHGQGTVGLFAWEGMPTKGTHHAQYMWPTHREKGHCG